MKKRYFFLILFIFSFVIRVCFFMLFEHDNKCMLMFDSGHYHNLAVTIAQTKSISNPDGSPQFYRLPGYPVYLALCYKFFGTDAHRSLWVQMALACLIPILVFALALVLFPGQIQTAQCAALAACIDPGFLVFSGLVMSEILFLIFFILFLCLFFRNRNTLFWAGLFLGTASLIRPVGHFVLILAIIFLLSSHKKFVNITALGAGWLSVAGIWLVRNYMLTGYLFLHTLTGVHFLNHSATQLVMQNKHISYQEAKKQINQEFTQAQEQKKQETGRQLLEIETSLIAEKIAYKHMLDNFFVTLKHVMQNMLKTLFSLYSSELLVIDSGGGLPEYGDQRSIRELLLKFLWPDTHNKNIIYFIYFEILFFLLLLLGFFGLLFDTKNRAVAIKIIPFIIIFVILCCACGFARLRLPYEPLLIIVSCKFWNLVLFGPREREKK